MEERRRKGREEKIACSSSSKTVKGLSVIIAIITQITVKKAWTERIKKELRLSMDDNLLIIKTLISFISNFFLLIHPVNRFRINQELCDREKCIFYRCSGNPPAVSAFEEAHEAGQGCRSKEPGWLTTGLPTDRTLNRQKVAGLVGWRLFDRQDMTRHFRLVIWRWIIYGRIIELGIYCGNWGQR